MCQWFRKNKILLNNNKYYVVSHFHYAIDDLLPTTTDLEILVFICKLTYYESIVNKTFKLLGFVIRKTNNIKTILNLHNALVRPNLDLYLKMDNVYPYMNSYNLLAEINVVRLSIRRFY